MGKSSLTKIFFFKFQSTESIIAYQDQLIHFTGMSLEFELQSQSWKTNNPQEKIL